jgi:hypothetical protein
MAGVPQSAASSGNSAKVPVLPLMLLLNSNSVVPLGPPLAYVRFTHIETDTACVAVRLIAGVLAYWFTLLADIALLNIPVIQFTPLNSVALYPFPEESAADVPVPSSNFQYPVMPDTVVETVRPVEPITAPEVA